MSTYPNPNPNPNLTLTLTLTHLLDAVAVVDVDVDVQHALVQLKQLEDGEHDVVGEAEARGLGLLCVMQPARPIDRDVRLAIVELRCAAEGSSYTELAKVVDAVKRRAVLADVESLRREGSDRVSRRGARRALWRAAVTASWWMFSPMVAGLMSRRKLRYSSEWKRAICSNVAGSGRYTASFEYSP